MSSTAGTSATSGVPAAVPRPRRLGAYLGLVPFFAFVGVFLLLPTAIVALGAFQDAAGNLTTSNIQVVISSPVYGETFGRSIQLSIITSLAGAIVGALLAWAIAGGNTGGWLRQTVIAASGVLAQFGGVMLAFGFLATFGINGLLTVLAQSLFGFDPLSGSQWVYGMTGLAVIYTYFQIPLMLIVFLPAVDGLRREWWDASASLGGGSWAYWRHVAGPILAPTFLGATLLLFTNAFSAYATAAALVSQGAPLVTLQIRSALTSEVILGQENVGKALALGMIVLISIVMLAYTVLQRRTARWVK